MSDRVGQQLGNYRLLRLIGRGSWASVYLGEHLHLNTQVAIKVLRAQVTDEALNSLSGSSVTNFHRFYGDANGDARVDVADLGAFAGTYLRASPDPLYLAYFDFNADGRVDVADLGAFAAHYLTVLP